MTPEFYKLSREARGTQEEVARRLGVSRSTVARREIGQLKINQEAILALLALQPPNEAEPSLRPEQTTLGY